MTNARDNFMGEMKTLHNLKVHRLHLTIIFSVSILILSTLLVLIYTPWVQTAYGMGEVNSPYPAHRMQPISALVDGQIENWHVREGEKVTEGQALVTLIDVDSNRLDTLRSQQASANKRLLSNKLSVENAQSNLARQKKLLKEGLVSERQVEQGEISLEKLKAEASKTLEYLDTLKINLARQEIRTKTAPMDGTVVRLKSGGSATFVKAGDILGWFVPYSEYRQISIKINGLDAVMVSAGKKVRIQFEGWPAFQFSGWPGVSVGTFSGVVSFIEPVADINGLFTVWISPSDEPDADPWPEHESTRLGGKARAWVLLEEVRLGYELWRQLNNFPPVLAQEGTM